MNRRQTNGKDKGAIHLPGMDAHDHQTFCGYCWNSEDFVGFITFEDTESAVTCPGCIEAASQALEILRDFKQNTKKKTGRRQ